MTEIITTPLVDESRSINSIVDVQWVRQNANSALAERVFNGYQAGDDIILRPPGSDAGGSGSGSDGLAGSQPPTGNDGAVNNDPGYGESRESRDAATGNDGAVNNDPGYGESRESRDATGGGQVPSGVDLSGIVNEAVSEAVARTGNADGSSSGPTSTSTQTGMMGVSSPVLIGAVVLVAIVVMGD